MDVVSNMSHVNTIIEDIHVQFLSQIDLQIEEPTMVDTIDEKLIIVLSEAEKLLQTLRESIGGYSEDEKKYKLQVLQGFLTSVVEPPTFQRPNMIDLPIRGSISIVQDNIKRSRMEHEKKRASSEIGEGSTPRPPLKQSSHMLISHSKQKRAIFRKLPKVTCDICAIETLVEGGANLVFCKHCDHEMFV